MFRDCSYLYHNCAICIVLSISNYIRFLFEVFVIKGYMLTFFTFCWHCSEHVTDVEKDIFFFVAFLCGFGEVS